MNRISRLQKDARGLYLSLRHYSLWYWLRHSCVLTVIAVTMVYLHHSTCGGDSPSHAGGAGGGGESPNLYRNIPESQWPKLHSRHKRDLGGYDDNTRLGLFDYFEDLEHDLEKDSEYLRSEIPDILATSNGTMPDISTVTSLTQNLVDFLKKPPINKYDFEYLINPADKCSGRDVDFLIMIPSARNNCQQRRNVRMSLLKKFMQVNGQDGVVLFFLGVAPSDIVNERSLMNQKKIEEEAKEYHDVVQENYMDVHRTLKTKAVSMLKWASRYCTHAKYVIKLEDDIRFDPFKFLDIVHNIGLRYDNFILGQVFYARGPVNRDPHSRYYVSEREYPGDTFPQFVMGGVQAYSSSTVRLLYEGSLRTPPIPLDDIYLTGLVADRLNISLVSSDGVTFQHHTCGARRL